MTSNKETKVESTNSLGEFLTQARLSKNWTIEIVEEKTKISQEIIKNIEAGAWNLFPVEAYLRSYLNSLSKLLDVDSKKVIDWYLSEKSGKNDYEYKTTTTIEEYSVEEEKKKKSFLFPILIIILGIGFFVLMNFVNQFEKSDTDYKTPSLIEDDSHKDSFLDSVLEEQVESPTMIHDAADLFIQDSSAKKTPETLEDSTQNTAKVDSITLNADSSLSSAEKPNSATTFISSSSIEGQEKQQNSSTIIELIGSDQVNSWVGIRRHKKDSVFLKEANLKNGAILRYEATDTVFVTVGNVEGLSKILLNKQNTPIPASRANFPLHFRVYNGKVF
jgi:transcriptional regulator with XRE-family HTH domain